MKNIPVFTTTAGVATVILREIPYRGEAYILPQSVFSTPEELCRECAEFCFAAGAKRVLVRLNAPVEKARFTCEIWELCRSAADLPQGTLRLTPVTDANENDYRELYNRRFAAVDNAAWCSAEDTASMIADGSGWLYYNGAGKAVGLGQVRGNELCAIAADAPGLGYALALSLLQKCEGAELRLKVASSNAAALRLYEHLGFEKRAVLSRWYEVQSIIPRQNEDCQIESAP